MRCGDVQRRSAPARRLLIDHNPFEKLGLKRSKGRKHVKPPAPGEVAR